MYRFRALITKCPKSYPLFVSIVGTHYLLQHHKRWETTASAQHLWPTGDHSGQHWGLRSAHLLKTINQISEDAKHWFVRVSGGSGVVVDKDNRLVLTTCHGVCDRPVVTVILNDNISRTARIVHSDPTVDLALLQIIDRTPLPANIVHIQWSEDPEEGDEVVVIGCPNNELTFNDGIVSCRSRALDNWCQGTYEYHSQTPDPKTHAIQHCAPAGTPFAGGPLVSLEKEKAIGLNIGGPTADIQYSLPYNPVVKEFIDAGKGRLGTPPQDWTNWTQFVANNPQLTL